MIAGADTGADEGRPVRVASAPAPPARGRAPWWSLAAIPLLGIGLWMLATDVPAWNTLWYLFAWTAWLLLLDAAIFACSGRSWIAAQGRRLPGLALWSIPFWYLYEAYNLRLQNWYYVFALRDDRWQLVVSFLAFATVLPACFLHAELMASLRLFERRRWRPLRFGRGVEATVQLLGVASTLLPLLWPRWAFALVWGLTLWLPALAARRRGGDSLLRDLEQGRPQRLLELLAGGLLAGLIWELFNFWARCKWIYTVPFFDRLKLFEMPLAGFLGFPLLAVGAAGTWSVLASAFASPAGGTSARRFGRKAVVGAAAAIALVASIAVYQGVLAATVRSRRPLLTELVGLDAGAAARLEGAGIPTPEWLQRAVARQGASGVALATGLPRPRIAAAWRHAVLSLHKGMGAPAASLLLRAGVADVAALGRADACSLTARLAQLARVEGIPTPRAAEVAVWIAAARGRSEPRR